MEKNKNNKKNKKTKTYKVIEKKEDTKKSKSLSQSTVNKRKKYSSKKADYKFENFYTSEAQLKDITSKSPPELIIQAYERLISVHAGNHVREGVELDDLMNEARMGIVEAIQEFNKKGPNKKVKKYNFHQACLYKIRQKVFQLCLRNANQIKTPYYIQRGCLHVGQIFKLMSGQSVAEKILGRAGPVTEQELIEFLYDENERLPLKPMKFIKANIKKSPGTKEFNQVLSGVLNHELGSRHSYVKNNLTDIAKVLHLKEKLYYTSSSNGMNYARVIGLILEARKTKTELTATNYAPQHNDLDKASLRADLSILGQKVCGERNFLIVIKNKVYDKTYDELAVEFGLKKSTVIEIIKECILKLRKDIDFQDLFKDN